MSSTRIAVDARIMDAVVPVRAARVDDLADDFRALFVEAYGRVVRTVWFVVHDHQVAEEITQDAFTELYRHWRRVHDYDEPALWVRRVALRKAQREAVRTARRPVLERQAPTSSPVDPGEVVVVAPGGRSRFAAELEGEQLRLEFLDTTVPSHGDVSEEVMLTALNTSAPFERETP